MQPLSAIALVVAFVAASTAVKGETDDQLRALYFQRDLVRMEEIAGTGDVRAEAWMGLMLQNRGRRAESKNWWRRAAEKGDQWAINMLASMLLSYKEYEEAAHWYKRGAEIGSPESQLAYAGILLDGRGVAKDEHKAAYWYSTAMARGERHAYLPLAELYATGTGVPLDPIEAYALATIAEELLDDSEFEPEREARELKARLASELSPEQIEAATSRAYELRS